MTETAVAGPEEQNFILSSLSPSLAQKPLALGIVVFLAIAFLIMAGPLSTLQLPQIPAFIPVYATVMLVFDSLTAILLFAHFSILRSRALLVLSGGWLFTALIVVPWTLTFPGVFAPGGLLGAGLQSTSWLYIIWHAGFPASVIAYALLKDGDPTKRLWHGWFDPSDRAVGRKCRVPEDLNETRAPGEPERRRGSRYVPYLCLASGQRLFFSESV
jgi:hypothetical protein